MDLESKVVAWKSCSERNNEERWSDQLLKKTTEKTDGNV